MWKSLKRQAAEGEKIPEVTLREKGKLVLQSIGVTILLNLCFYRHPAAFLPLSFIGLWYFKREEEMLLIQKREVLRKQFKDMLLLSMAGQRAGYSPENAFLQGYEDLKHLYGEESSICRILQKIRAGLENHIQAADLWKTVGEESGVVEIREFAHVFTIAKESGGDMAAVLESTAQTIADKVETKNEIEVILSARRLEMKIMNMMPFALMLYITLTSPGYFDSFYGSVQGVVIMTGALLLYLAAYLWGEKIAGKDKIWQ